MSNSTMSFTTTTGEPVSIDLFLNILASSYIPSILTLILLIFLEYISWTPSWKEKYNASQKVQDLYNQAWTYTLIHMWIIAPVAKAIVGLYYVVSDAPIYHWTIALPGTILTQGIGYAVGHSLMHTKELYWIHKFHHKFSEKTFVRPVSANAVTFTEFCFAYVLPIITGLILLRPSSLVMDIIATTISLTNLLIHTPEEVLPMDSFPDFLVTNIKHAYHHEVDLRKNYSAPIFDYDGILDKLGLIDLNKNKSKKN